MTLLMNKLNCITLLQEYVIQNIFSLPLFSISYLWNLYDTFDEQNKLYNTFTGMCYTKYLFASLIKHKLLEYFV